MKHELFSYLTVKKSKYAKWESCINLFKVSQGQKDLQIIQLFESQEK